MRSPMWILPLLLALGCGAFVDFDRFDRQDPHTETTDTDTLTEEATHTDSQTEDIGTDTLTQSETEPGTGDTSSHSDTQSDSRDTDTGTETLTGTESSSESETVDTDTCEEATCADFPGQCHPMCNGAIVDCPCLDTDAPYCIEHECKQCDDQRLELCHGHLCGDDHLCDVDCLGDELRCQQGYHCDGSQCEQDLPRGEPCDKPNQCEQGLHCNSGLCCEQDKTCCAQPAACTQPHEPICDTVLNHCVGCTEKDMCVEQHLIKPVCDETTGECVECVQDLDCRPGSDAPFPSLYGVCTAERVCTCWVSEANPTGNCGSKTCPEGYVCAQDYLGETRFSCLRECASPGSAIVSGLSCTERITSTIPLFVWAPVTTCHAFARFSADCSAAIGICSIDGVGGLDDGICTGNGFCTYACWTDPPPTKHDEWCPKGHTCGNVMSPYCQ